MELDLPADVIGFFAWVLTNFNSLAQIILQSFSSLGLKAAGSGLSSSDFLQPGKLAQVGLDAGRPILTAAGQLMGYVSFFRNFVLMISWLIVLMAFFVLAVQLFISLIEFKLTTLTGFVLIPFALFNKTAFLAEKVLGNVVASGVKILVLAVITGIGTTLFSQFTAATGTNQPTLDDALSLVLAALALLGLGIFGPGIATGLVSGAPQLGIGTAMTVGGLGAAAATGTAALGGAVIGAGRMVWPGSNDNRPSGGASSDGPTSTGPNGGPGGSGGPSGTSGPSSPAASGSSASTASASSPSSSSGSASSSSPNSTAASSPSKPAPAWANRLMGPQSVGQHISSVEQALTKAEHAGGSASISLAERDQP